MALKFVSRAASLEADIAVESFRWGCEKCIQFSDLPPRMRSVLLHEKGGSE